MTESGIQRSIARTRTGLAPSAGTSATTVDADRVAAILATVPDPELPVVSVADLGMIHRVAVDDLAIRVTVLPTFVGCPAIELIREAIADALVPLGRPVVVAASFEVPWTSDRITPTGRRALAEAGIAPPADPAETRCPYCGSERVVLDSLFAATQCRSLFYCRACRQPFEAMKLV